MTEASTTLASPAHRLVSGDVLGRKYRLDRQLGEGGQGCIWQAHNLMLDLPVAIKLVHGTASDRWLPERLFREARAAAMLGHPSIVRIFDVGQTTAGLPFLVMELLTGESLAKRLDTTGGISPELALRLLLPVVDALSTAHAHGIVHRDVKPDNVFLASSGAAIQPKLLDFGIARVTQGRKLPRLTKSGDILGTPEYLPPEQASGRNAIDERADIWSLCVTLYECVTGALPFRGETWLDVCNRICKDDPTPISEHGVADDELWRLLRRGLEKSPDDRWQSMPELGRALAGWLFERGVTSDICGTSLEARWLSDPVALELRSSKPIETEARARKRRDLRHAVIAITGGLALAAGVMLLRARSTPAVEIGVSRAEQPEAPIVLDENAEPQNTTRVVEPSVMPVNTAQSTASSASKAEAALSVTPAAPMAKAAPGGKPHARSDSVPTTTPSTKSPARRSEGRARTRASTGTVDQLDLMVPY